MDVQTIYIFPKHYLSYLVLQKTNTLIDKKLWVLSYIFLKNANKKHPNTLRCIIVKWSNPGRLLIYGKLKISRKVLQMSRPELLFAIRLQELHLDSVKL